MKNIELLNLINENLEHRDDGNFYWKKAKKGCAAGRKAGAYRRGYVVIGLDNKIHLAHRLAFLLSHGYLPDHIDHINGNKSDNRIQNLREATRSQNLSNRVAPKTNSTGIKNVSWDKQKKTFKVVVGINNKQKTIGRFKDIELAELVAIEARNKYHGDFARHV